MYFFAQNASDQFCDLNFGDIMAAQLARVYGDPKASRVISKN
jgi:hypothetical protein